MLWCHLLFWPIRARLPDATCYFKIKVVFASYYRFAEAATLFMLKPMLTQTFEEIWYNNSSKDETCIKHQKNWVCMQASITWCIIWIFSSDKSEQILRQIPFTRLCKEFPLDLKLEQTKKLWCHLLPTWICIIPSKQPLKHF